MAESLETSPLLTDVDRQEQNDQEAFDTSTRKNDFFATSYFRLPIKVLTIFLLVTSVLALVVLVGTDIAIHYAPFTQWYWNATDSIKPTGIWVFVSVIFSIVNLIYMIPIFVNIPLDIILPIFLINCASTLVRQGWPNGSWCGPDRGFGPDPVPIECDKWVVAMKVLIGVGAGITVIVGLIHLILVLLRIIAVIRTRFWTRASFSKFSFSIGRIRFGFTAEVISQESGIASTEDQPESSSA